MIKNTIEANSLRNSVEIYHKGKKTFLATLLPDLKNIVSVSWT